MGQRRRLCITGFALGRDRAGAYVKLRLSNDRAQPVQITRYQYETEGIHSGGIIGPVEIAAGASRQMRYAVHAFHDVGLWVHGRGTSARRNPQRVLTSFSADWAPTVFFQVEHASLTARPTSAKRRRCEALLDQLRSLDPTGSWSRPGCELWPARVTSDDQWTYFVACVVDGLMLRTGPYLRQQGQRLQRWYTSPDGHGWVEVRN